MERLNRKSQVIILLVIAIVAAGGVYFSKSEEYKEKELQLTERQSEVEKIVENNSEVNKKQTEQDKKLGFDQVKSKTNEFYNLFFNWSSWVTYSDNMNNIQREFPKLNEYSPVDISGLKVGTGQSPISSKGEVTFYTTKDKNRMISIVTQIRNSATTSTVTTWRGITKIDADGMMQLEEMGSYIK